MRSMADSLTSVLFCLLTYVNFLHFFDNDGRVWKGGPDPAFPPLYRESPASRTFFISFPNPASLFQENTLSPGQTDSQIVASSGKLNLGRVLGWVAKR